MSKLQHLSDLFQYWLNWNKHQRDAENLESSNDIHLMCVPPSWPTRGSISRWVEAIKEADAELTELREKVVRLEATVKELSWDGALNEANEKITRFEDEKAILIGGLQLKEIRIEHLEAECKRLRKEQPK